MATEILFYLYFCLISVALSAPHDVYQTYISAVSHNVSYLSDLEHEEDEYRQRQQDYVGAEFPCSILPPSPSIPTSVHQLRPADVKVVAAMGDSFTAAFGAKAGTILGLLKECRGISWSIGGDGSYKDHETLPNILKKYNPDLVGYSMGAGDNENNAGFNVAVIGSESDNLPSQARTLIARMKNDPEVDFANDWKVITIMSGANDICHVCENPEFIEKFIENLTASLNILMAEVPRVFVNLVETVNVHMSMDLSKKTGCPLLYVACPCALFPGKPEETKLVHTIRDIHSRVEKLVKTGRYDVKDDFTVVVQPFMKETFTLNTWEGEKIDSSYFAPDCFHFSWKGHAAAANALWNNMIERVGEKRTSSTPGKAIECPTETSPYFFTKKNTNGTLQVKHDEKDDEKVNDKKMSTSAWRNTISIGIPVLLLALVGGALAIVWKRKRTKTVKRNLRDYQSMQDDTTPEHAQ